LLALSSPSYRWQRRKEPAHSFLKTGAAGEMQKLSTLSKMTLGTIYPREPVPATPPHLRDSFRAFCFVPVHLLIPSEFQSQSTFYFLVSLLVLPLLFLSGVPHHPDKLLRNPVPCDPTTDLKQLTNPSNTIYLCVGLVTLFSNY
jgi:hypothetical protein